MGSKKTYFLFAAAVMVSLLVNVFFGRYFSAKISTLPLLNRWNLLSPQAPIVINTREEVRVSDTGDIQSPIASAKTKISVLLLAQGGKLSELGGALNLTNDGLFLVPKQLLHGRTVDNLYIRTNSGQTGRVLSVIELPSINASVIKADLSGVPTAAFAVSQNLVAGEKIIVLYSSSRSYDPIFEETRVSASQQNGSDKIFFSDFPSRSFQLQQSPKLPAGSALFNVNAELVGIWDGQRVISSDVLRDLQSSFASNSPKPAYGFYYAYVSPAASQLFGLSQGARVLDSGSQQPAVILGSTAEKAGLKQGDIIIRLGEQKVLQDNPLEPLLQRLKPGDLAQLTVVRGQDTINLNITVGSLETK